jgi:uncharacterized protein (DUF1499 family)
VPQTQSRVARLSTALGGAGAAGLVAGPLLIQIGALSSFVGFRLFMLGALLGFAALVLGAVGLWLTRAGSGRTGRGAAAAGAGLGAAATAVVLLGAGSAAGLPAINDITTDPADPPAFAAALELPANRGRDMGYPGESFASPQRSAYPDLAPLRVVLPPAEAFARARAAIDELGWEVTAEDPVAGRLEATDTSPVFRFVDDIAIRIRADGAGSRVDVRSKSRDGKGDLGANAARIRAFLGAFTR